MTRITIDLTESIHNEYDRIVKKFPGITREELEGRLYSSFANILSDYTFVEGSRGATIDRIIDMLLNGK